MRPVRSNGVRRGRSFPAPTWLGTWATSITTFSILLLLSLTITEAADPTRDSNRSGLGRLSWSTVAEVADLRGDSPAPAVFGDGDGDEIDGGFSTLEGMLQWAIGHSDPYKLKEAAQDIRRLSAAELEKKQMEIKELMEKLKMPSDAQLMQIAIDDLSNFSLSLDDHHRALKELLILVEPIDNANDLNKLGGLVAVIRELSHPDPDTRRLSAWVLGKASQNNPVVQKQVLELGALTRLIELVKSSFVEEAVKALYAVSALIRNNLHGQTLFYSESGDLMLQSILSNSSVDIRLRQKAVSLVADLAESHLENSHRTELSFFTNDLFLKSMVDITASTNLDLQEKALVAIKNLLQLRSTEALVFKDFCGLEGALKRMRRQLQDLLVDDYRSYAMDIETLCSEIELIFHKKLETAETAVPT